MAQKVLAPEELSQLAAQTIPDRPWLLRVLSMRIREYAAAMSRLWVEGEVTTLQCCPGAKVQFFILRDLKANASITVKIMAYLLPAATEPGSRTVMCVKPDFYEVNGSSPLRTDEVRPVGLGDILARIEQLKSRLAAEGLFSAERKTKALFPPGKIGLICGRNTKARGDALASVLGRWPAARFDVREVKVQGEGAVEAMIGVLESPEEAPGVDVVVFARGGGNVEDFLPFSDERFVCAVVKAKKPVVPAIGHKGDSPILDLTADLRALILTDAVKRIVPDVIEELATIAEAARRGRSAVQAGLDRAQSELGSIRARPALAFPETIVDMHEEDSLFPTRWMRMHVDRVIADAAGEPAAAVVNLRTLSLWATPDRGYSILFSEGSVVSNTAAVRKGQEVEAILARGRLVLVVAAVAEQDRAVAEEGLAVNQNNFTAAAPQGGKYVQEKRP